MTQNVQKNKQLSRKERLEELDQEILEVFRKKEELYRQRLKELDKHLEMSTGLYLRHKEFFQELVHNVEELALMRGLDYSNDPKRQEYLDMIDDAEEKHQKNVAKLEAEKYRIEEEQGYLQYRREKFLAEKDQK